MSQIRLWTYRRTAGIFPKFIIKNIEKQLSYSGISEDAQEWIGRRFLLSLLFSFSCVLFYVQYFAYTIDLLVAGIALLAFSVLLFIFYLELFFTANERTKNLEKVLPDFLLLMVSNLRAGLPLFSAFVHSAKPEFGALYQEIKNTTAKMGGKASVSDALLDLSSHFNSPIFRRVVVFFVKGMKAGGQIAKLLDRSADEIRKIQDLRNELLSGTRTYSIFLLFIVVLIMPFLLAVSTHFLSTFLVIQSDKHITSIEGSEEIAVFSGKILITPEEMANISIIMLIITSFLVSALIGVIITGMPHYGIKYFLIIAVVSTSAFIMMREIIKGMLSAFVGV